MFKTKFVAALAVSLSMATSVAVAQDAELDLPSGELEVQWIALAGEAGIREYTLARGEEIEFARIRPSSLLEADDRLQDERGKKMSKNSIYFAPVTNHSGTVCEPMRALRSINVICLIDADRDGTFERYFKTEPNSEIFDRGTVGEIAMLGQPVKLTRIAAEDAKMELDIDFGFSGPQGGLFQTARQSFWLCYDRWVPALVASGKWVSSCIPGISFKEDQFPQSLKLIGRIVTLNGVAGKTASVTIETPEGEVAY